MNFLNSLVIPESIERLELLRYLLVIVTILFVTYVSIVLISSTVSAVADWWGRKRDDKNYMRFARDLADLAAPTRGTILALAVIPLITSVLIYAQLLYDSGIGVTSYLTVSAVFYFVGFYFLYGYKRSFHFESIYGAFRNVVGSKGAEVEPVVEQDLELFEHSAALSRQRGGRRSAILFWIGTWMFVGTTRLAFSPGKWHDSSVLSVLFSGDTFWSLLNFTVAAVAITSAAIHFFFFGWEKGIAKSSGEGYRSFVKKIVLPAGLVAASLEPALIFFEVQSIPQTGVSNLTFAVASAGIVIALFVLLFFYSMLKDSSLNLGSYAFTGVVLLVLAWTAKDEIALSYATRTQGEVIDQRYESMLAELNPNTAMPAVSGEDIYNGRCSACHRFDVKLVGPPYNQTLPNFVGKMDSLEDFIMNPRQVVPGYPPMPNQGLRPDEVKAVAEYIMGVYLKSHPQPGMKQAAGSDTTKVKS